MEANKILNADVLDIVFEGRNKEYGAYDLRKSYNKRLTFAMIIAASLAVLMLGASFLSQTLKANKKAEVVVKDIELEQVQQQEEKKNEPPPPPPPPKVEPPKVEITKFTPPKIVKDEEVKEDEKPPEVEKLEDTKIGVVNQEGTKDEGIVVAPPSDEGKGVVAAPPVEEDKPFTKVEIEAGFPGGDRAWVRYLQNNLRADKPVDEGAPPGQYQVIVQFIVDREGNISEVTPLTKHGYGMEDEAVKVIKKGPKWIPAQQNGRAVKAYRKQPITFLISDE